MMPDQIGDNLRWTTTELERYITLADNAVRERIDDKFRQQVITLTDDTLEYDLDSEFIAITSVEFAIDGTTYDWYLRPGTFDDFDRLNIRWRQDGGTRPWYYTILSAPGMTGKSKILIYRPIPVVTAQTIRVKGTAVTVGNDTIPDDIQHMCHVPYVMSILKAREDPQRAADWFGKYLTGCEEAKRRTRNRFVQSPVDVEVGW